ncbi:hypothetical protein DFJ77DRAFT_215927 [Powellomyces hirtus]|nr:hypothetical protein DFJ77DRAFT_215927 [Powellomyces hirtus]
MEITDVPALAFHVHTFRARLHRFIANRMWFIWNAVLVAGIFHLCQADTLAESSIGRSKRAPLPREFLSNAPTVHARAPVSTPPIYAGVALGALSALSSVIKCFPVYGDAKTYESIKTYCTKDPLNIVSDLLATQSPGDHPLPPQYACSNATKYLLLLADSSGDFYALSPRNSGPPISFGSAVSPIDDPTLTNYWSTCDDLASLDKQIDPNTGEKRVKLIKPQTVVADFVPVSDLIAYYWQPWKPYDSVSTPLCVPDFVGCMYRSWPEGGIFSPPSMTANNVILRNRDEDVKRRFFPAGDTAYVRYRSFEELKQAFAQCVEQLRPIATNSPPEAHLYNNVVPEIPGSLDRQLVVNCMTDRDTRARPTIDINSVLTYVTLYNDETGNAIFSAVKLRKLNPVPRLRMSFYSMEELPETQGRDRDYADLAINPCITAQLSRSSWSRPFGVAYDAK